MPSNYRPTTRRGVRAYLDREDGRRARVIARYEKETKKRRAKAEADARAALFVPKAERPLCGAATRAGGLCRARVVVGKSRCRMHGGLSTGPKSEAGRAAIAESNRRRAAEARAQKDAETVEERRRVVALQVKRFPGLADSLSDAVKQGIEPFD